MNIRWLWFDYVPEGIELTKEQRRWVRERTWSEVGRRWFVMLFIAVVVGTAIFLLNRSFAPESLFVAPPTILITFEISSWLFARPAVFRAIREAGVNVCPKCGYDLRGQSGDGCSECGWDTGDEALS